MANRSTGAAVALIKTVLMHAKQDLRLTKDNVSMQDLGFDLFFFRFWFNVYSRLPESWPLAPVTLTGQKNVAPWVYVLGDTREGVNGSFR